MKTIQIPSSTIDDRDPQHDCVKYEDQLNICFQQSGDFAPDPNSFSPNIPSKHIDINQAPCLAGGYTAPKKHAKVCWTFTLLDGITQFTGTIEVTDAASCPPSTPPDCGSNTPCP